MHLILLLFGLLLIADTFLIVDYLSEPDLDFHVTKTLITFIRFIFVWIIVIIYIIKLPSKDKSECPEYEQVQETLYKLK